MFTLQTVEHIHIEQAVLLKNDGVGFPRSSFYQPILTSHSFHINTQKMHKWYAPAQCFLYTLNLYVLLLEKYNVYSYLVLLV